MPEQRSHERRAAIRRQATLPFAWHEVPASATLADACRALGVPDVLALQSRLAGLDEELQQTCAAVTDAPFAEALLILNRKLSVLEEALLGHAPVPAEHALTLSADGIGFGSERVLTPGAWLAVHLVLPVRQHVVCRAQVSHCRAVAADAHQVGAMFHELPDSAARRLTRYAIGRDRDL